MKHLISADAKLKITAVNRETKKEHETIMTYSEWVQLKKSFDYDWKAVAL